MRLPVENALALAALTLLAACGGSGTVARADAGPALSSSGPAADYPMVLGPGFVIDGVTYIPADTMNYDAVGRAVADSTVSTGVTGMHRTLPLPSYVEVTALDSGKTALVRIERRGPMQGGGLIALSPAAATQLGLSQKPEAPVRVRRVNPVEADRAALRAGEPAAPRMDTPPSLLAALLRKLDRQEGKGPATVDAAPAAHASASQNQAANPQEKPKGDTKPAAPAATAAPPKPAPAAGRAGYVVQIGAFSSKANAEGAARKAGGSATAAGKFWRVRTGPFSTQAEARTALAKARAAGYGDARIQTVD